MTHWWHNICGRCGKKVAPQGEPFCRECNTEVEAELTELLTAGGEQP